MAPRSDAAPAWLFSFVDLAFLLLIAMTQLGGDPNAPELGEIRVPQIHGSPTAPLPAGARDRWQLRVHPAEGDAPYELVAAPEPPRSGTPPERIGVEELRLRLEGLRASHAAKPLLAPHGDSRSADLLDAVALLDELWPRSRGATVARVPGLR